MIYCLQIRYSFEVVFSYGFLYVFFFKQKTAYEMRISDWSSDVCSSDLLMQLALCVPAVMIDPYSASTRSATSGVDPEVTLRMLEIGRASCRERVCQYV